MSRISKSLQYIILCIIISTISAVYAYKRYLELPNNLTKPSTILIKYGATSKNIVKILAANNIIKMPLIFYCMVLYHNKINNTLKAGEYIFYPYETPKKVLKKITGYNAIIRKITIPEHFNINQITHTIQSNQALSGDISDVQLKEGDLLPSTYFFYYGDDKRKILDMMKREKNLILNKYIKFLDKNSPLKNKNDVLTLASIVEQEANNDRDKSKIASVFINRLNRKMKLQSCVTVIYGLTQGLKPLNRSLTFDDLTLNSPYNTYKFYGLPKGPISCPGESAIKSVIFPEKSNFLYFRASKQGKTFFSKTFQEHIKNKDHH